MARSMPAAPLALEPARARHDVLRHRRRAAIEVRRQPRKSDPQLHRKIRSTQLEGAADAHQLGLIGCQRGRINVFVASACSPWDGGKQHRLRRVAGHETHEGHAFRHGCEAR